MLIEKEILHLEAVLQIPEKFKDSFKDRKSLAFAVLLLIFVASLSIS